MTKTNLERRLRNGKASVKRKTPRWLGVALGLLAGALFFAPWWAGGLYVGPRPVPPDSLLGALVWSADMPLLGMALVGTLGLMALVVGAWHVEMARLPVGRVLVPFLLFLLWLALSMLIAGSGWMGTLRIAQWSLALLMVIGITLITRRGMAGYWLVGAIVLSASLMGLRVHSEYLVNALAGVSNWRVFGSFFNPNMLAGYFVMTAPLTMGLLLMTGRMLSAPRARWVNALLTVGLWLQVSGLVLTASRLGVLAFLGVTVLFFGVVWRWRVLNRDFLLRLGVVGVLVVGMGMLSLPTAQRLTPQTATQEVHSGAFRIETWKGTLRMALANPIVGVGTGAFEVHYPRYAHVGFTRSAHNTYLEIASESGWLALLLLITLGVGWLTRALQTEIPPSRTAMPGTFKASGQESGSITDWRPLRVGIVAGAVGAALHNAVDSDLQVFANLLTLAGLLGLGLALAPDGVYVVPLRPMERRGTTILLAGTLVLLIGGMGLGEVFANQARYSALLHQVPQAEALYSTARSLDARNPDYLMEAGELYFALGRYETALAMMERAVQLKPSARNWYRLGLYYERARQKEQARQAFQNALEADPHSLPALIKLAQMATPDPNNPRLSDEARGYYERVVAIERSPYGTVLAVPQLVETAYGFAHLALARHEQAVGNLERAESHYQSALKVFRTYREVTYPFHYAGRSLGLYNPERENQILQAYLLTLRLYSDLLERQGNLEQARTLREEYNRLLNSEQQE